MTTSARYVPVDDRAAVAAQLAEAIAAGDADVEAQIDSLRQHARLEALILRLPERQQLVMRHSLAGRSGAWIGRDIGLSRERVRQLRNLAVKRLRAWLVSPTVLREFMPPHPVQETTMSTAPRHLAAAAAKARSAGGGAVAKAKATARLAAMRIDADNLAGASPGACIVWDQGARCRRSIKTRMCCNAHHEFLRKRGWPEVPTLTAEEYSASGEVGASAKPPEPPAPVVQVDELATARERIAMLESALAGITERLGPDNRWSDDRSVEEHASDAVAVAVGKLKALDVSGERIAELEADAAGVRALLEAAYKDKPMPLDTVKRERPLTYQTATTWAVVTNRILRQVGEALGEVLGPEDDNDWGDLLEVVRVLADEVQGGPTVTTTLVEDLAVALGHAPPALPSDYSDTELLTEVRELRRGRPPESPSRQELALLTVLLSFNSAAGVDAEIIGLLGGDSRIDRLKLQAAGVAGDALEAAASVDARAAK